MRGRGREADRRKYKEQAEGLHELHVDFMQMGKENQPRQTLTLLVATKNEDADGDSGPIEKHRKIRRRNSIWTSWQSRTRHLRSRRWLKQLVDAVTKALGDGSQNFLQ